MCTFIKIYTYICAHINSSKYLFHNQFTCIRVFLRNRILFVLESEMFFQLVLKWTDKNQSRTFQVSYLVIDKSSLLKKFFFFFKRSGSQVSIDIFLISLKSDVRLIALKQKLYFPFFQRKSWKNYYHLLVFLYCSFHRKDQSDVL